LRPSWQRFEKSFFGSVSALGRAYNNLLEDWQQASHYWLNRMQTKAMTTRQEWTGRQIEMIAEDSKLLVADTQKLMATGARLLWNGWQSDRSEGLLDLRTES
jgi:hypothetical protein